MQPLLPYLHKSWAYIRRKRLHLPIYFRKIYFNLVVFLSLILFLTGTSIIFYTYNEFLQDFSTIVDEKVDSISDVTGYRIESFLSPLEEIAEASTFIFRALEKNTVFELNQVILGFFRSYPQISGIVVALDEGRFFIFSRVQQSPLEKYKFPPKAFFQQEVIDKTFSPDGKRVLSFFNKKGEEIVFNEENLESHEARGDPRKTKWYIETKNSKSPFLSPLALLYNDSIGLTLSYPLIKKSDRSFFGAVGVQMNIHSLCDIVKRQTSGALGVACLMDKKGQIIAHPDVEKVFRLTMQGLKVKQVQDLKDYHLNQAFDLYLKKDQRVFFSQKKSDFFRDIVRIQPLKTWFKKDSPWGEYVLASVFLGDRLTSHIQQARQDMFIFSVIMLLVAATFMFIIARRVSQPIVQIVSYLKKIQNMDFDISFDASFYFYEISHTVEVLKRVVQSLQSFSKFVPKALVRQLFYAKKDAVLGGDRKILTILFSDIMDFTKITETLDGETLMLHLSDYFEAMTHVIQDNNGIIDKYIGDAIMSFWGAPVADEQQAIHACRAALESQKKLFLLNQKWKNEGKPVLLSRFGISTGEVIVGNIGSFDRFQYTALGDTVNLASRLEGSNKYYGTNILVSESTYRYTRGGFIFRPVDLVAVKGKERPVQIYELLGEMGVMPTTEESRLLEFCWRTEQAFQFYLDRNWEKALRRYQYIFRDFGEDRLAKTFIERCVSFLKTPPPGDWDGVQRLENK